MEPSFEQMQSEYPHFRKFVYAKMREIFERELPPLEGDNLEEIARQEGAVPLESFIAEIESPKQS